jgi:hypothetical protein
MQMIFDFPYSGGGGAMAETRAARETAFVQALAKSQRLQTVVIPPSGITWVYSLLKRCPLRAIQVKDSSGLFPLQFAREEVDNDPILKALVRFPEHL